MNWTKIVEMENKLYRDYLIYKTGNTKKDKTYEFQKFKTIWSFRRKNYNNDLSLYDAIELQIRLIDDIDTFIESTKPQELVRKKTTKSIQIRLYFLMQGEKFLMFLNVEYFQKENKEKDLQVF